MRQYTFKTRLVAALLSGVVLCGTPAYIMAEDEDLTNQLDSIQQQVNQQNAAKADAETVIGSVSEQLRQIEEQLRQATAELGTIKEQRVAVENDITLNERQLAEAQKRLEGRESVFYKRVRDIYINGRLSYLDVVIGSKDFSDFANRLEVLKRIIDSDITLINEIKKERADIEAHKQKLEADRAKLVELEKAALAKQAEIEQKKAERNVVLQKAQNDRATAMQAIEELNASSAQVSAMLKERQAARAPQLLQRRRPRLNPLVGKVHQIIGYKVQDNLAGLLVVKSLPLMAIVFIQFGELQFITPVLILALMKVHLFMLLMVAS